MTALAREMIYAIVRDLGQKAFLEKVSDPYWFQSLGCVLGFDWHSSGLTTTVTGALKEGLRGMERELGIFIAGGKGATSRKTPEQIQIYSERHHLQTDPSKLIYASRMSAKVDNTAVQDGYQLYHHVMIFSHKGEWAVVQQGMNSQNRTARRYHWLSDAVTNFTNEPHSAICCDRKYEPLNMVAAESEQARIVSAELSREGPEKIAAELKKIKELKMPLGHNVTLSDIDPKRLQRILTKTYEVQPRDFERLLGIRGVGPKTVRALSLISEVIYGKPPSYRDPARFSFAVGGKDGTPYPVNRKTYDSAINVMKQAIDAARIGNSEKLAAVKRLARYYDF